MRRGIGVASESDQKLELAETKAHIKIWKRVEAKKYGSIKGFTNQRTRVVWSLGGCRGMDRHR